MKRWMKLAPVSLLALSAACTSDVSGDGTGPNLGRSTLLATMRGGGQIPVALDATDVYWLEAAGLFRCAKSGCNLQPTTLAAAPLSDGPTPIGSSSPFTAIGSIVVGGSTVYWAPNGPAERPIYACPTSGCPAGPQKLGEVASSTSSALQADASGVLFLASTNGGPASIVTCPPTGCGSAPRVVAQATNASGSPLSFALADGRVYFFNPNNGGGPAGPLPFGLISCPTSGCSSDVRVHYALSATAGPGPNTQGAVLAADSSAVYLSMASGSGSALTRCDLPACDGKLQNLTSPSQSVAITNTTNTGTRIFQTPDALYALLTQCTGPCAAPTLLVCAKTGCPEGPTTLQADATFPLSNQGSGNNFGGSPTIAVDASGVYWSGVPSYFNNASFLLRSPLK